MKITQFGPGQEYTVFIYNLNEKGLLITCCLSKDNSRLESLRGCPVLLSKEIAALNEIQGSSFIPENNKR